MVIGEEDQSADRLGVGIFGDQLFDGGRGLGIVSHPAQRVGDFRVRQRARVLFQTQTLNTQQLFEPAVLVGGRPGPG